MSSSDFEITAQRINAFRPHTGDTGIFSSTGDTWSHARAIVRPALGRMNFSNLGFYEKHFQNLQKLIPRGETVDLQALLRRFTIDTASEYLLGESFNALDPHQSEHMKTVNNAFDAVNQGLAWRYVMETLSDIIPRPEFHQGVAILHEHGMCN